MPCQQGIFGLWKEFRTADGNVRNFLGANYLVILEQQGVITSLLPALPHDYFPGSWTAAPERITVAIRQDSYAKPIATAVSSIQLSGSRPQLRRRSSISPLHRPIPAPRAPRSFPVWSER